jgi:hypothetical protein
MAVTSQNLTDAEKVAYERIIKAFKDAGKVKSLEKIQAGIVRDAIQGNGTIENKIKNEVKRAILGANLKPDDFPSD